MANKRFDCLKLQHKGGDRVYEATKGMTQEELLAWWEERNKQFQAAREARGGKRSKADAPPR